MPEDVKQCGGPEDPSCSLKQYVPVPVKGEFFVRNGVVMPVLESEFTDYAEDSVSYTVWVNRDDDE